VSGRSNKLPISFGVLLIFFGCIFNEWTLTTLFSSDGVLEPSSKLIIWLFDAICVLIGLAIIGYKVYGRKREILFSVITFVLFFSMIEIACLLFIKREVHPLISDGVLHHRLRPHLEWV